MNTDIIVIGAGIAGLACGRGLAGAGLRVRLLEKSRGVGGRCATRRVEGQPVDHGVAFLHGDDAEFLDVIRTAGGSDLIEGWPRKIRGSGRPCQPRAFGARERRWAVRSGVSTFAKELSRSLDIVLGSRVISLEVLGGAFQATDEYGRTHLAPSLVVALPAAQAFDLLATLGGEKAGELTALRHLLFSVSAAPCLTVIAGYPPARAPEWEMVYPEESPILQSISHDSSKRPEPPRTILVLQALPSWSRVQWEESDDAWTEAMLAEAARRVGDWAEEPDLVLSHRWRLATLSGGGDLTSPYSVVFGDGTRIGCVGEAFAPGGGVQAAWRSGRRLAERWKKEDWR